MKTSNDYDFMFKLAYRYDLGYISDPLALYRKHTTNISYANLDQIFKEATNFNYIRALLRQWELPLKRADRAAIRAQLGQAFEELAYGYRLSGEYGKSFKAYCAGLSWSLRPGAVLGLIKVPLAWAAAAITPKPRVGTS